MQIIVKIIIMSNWLQKFEIEVVVVVVLLMSVSLKVFEYVISFMQTLST